MTHQPGADDRNDLEARVRHALHAQADRVSPSPDGLHRIRRRALGRGRQQGLTRTGAALAVAAAAAAAILVVPRILATDDAHNGAVTPHGALGSAPAVSDGARGSAPSTRAAESADRSAAPTATPAPSRASSAGPSYPTTARTGVPSMKATTVVPRRSGTTLLWPYADLDSARRAIGRGDASARNTPERAALSFVGQFVGPGSRVSARTTVVPRSTVPTGSSGSASDAARVTIHRALPNSPDHVVCVVALLGVGKPKTAHWLVRGVVGGDGSVRLDDVTAPAAPSTMTVSGTLAKRTGLGQQLHVSLREAGSPDEIAGGSLSPTSGAWRLPLNLYRSLTRPGVVTAWTVDASGRVLSLEAKPVG